jgi:hypothetical protein
MKLDTVLTSNLSTAAPFGAPHGKGRAFRLRAHLIARVIVVLLPPRAFSGAAAWIAYGGFRAAADARLVDTARALAGGLDTLFACHEPGVLPATGSAGNGGPGNIPCAGVSYEAGAALAPQTGRRIRLFVEGAFEDRHAENLLTTVAGQGEELLVLSAHIDGHDLAYSAIDNASGLACALTVIEAIRDIVPGLKRGVQVGLFNIEEWALLGSAVHLAQMAPAERAKRVLNVNLDSLAGAEGITALTSGVPGMVEFLHTALAAAGMSVGISAPFMGNSDHANYLRHGIPALRLCTGFDRPQSNMRFLLTPADTPDKVHPHQLKLAASIAALLVLAGCASPAAPVPRLDEASAQRITA